MPQITICLAQKRTEYETFNSFSAAISGKSLIYKLVDWSAYNNALRANDELDVEEYTDEYSLTFSRIPGYEDLPHKDYMPRCVAWNKTDLEPNGPRF